ncbi:MAG: hypothetical protein K0S74_1174 [Chlamydiales bacterium]|jgi:HAD superfamily hydrolase (TIGR01509 family)|nr:hypothetical protein [Chlamydiales bacterium]
MDWIFNYQLFLFDFDGLLVNTEQLHFKAYQQMAAKRGLELPWDFKQYCMYAHYGSTALRDAIYDFFPNLKETEPDWNLLYQEKRRQYTSILKEGGLELMPGVSEFLEFLSKNHLQRCVVTHSPQEQVFYIRDQFPILQTIPHWITRENYTNPKPDPECYMYAIQKYAKPGDQVIGFEDSPRGLTALKGTSAKPVLIVDFPYPNLSELLATKNASHFSSFNELMRKGIFP